VDGTWQLREGELKLKQEYQTVTGSLVSGGADTMVKGKLNGDQITFTAGKTEYTGRVNGSTMEGSTKSGGNNSSFSATKK
jgi:hypothetical protein